MVDKTRKYATNHSTTLHAPQESTTSTLSEPEGAAAADALPGNQEAGEALLGNQRAESMLEGEGRAGSDFSPADMAEYLYFTQQFDAFFAGLDRLVNSSQVGRGSEAP